MIHELLRAEQVLLNPRGSFRDVVRRLSRTASQGRERIQSEVEKLLASSDAGAPLPDRRTALPHLQLEGLPQPFLAVALSETGIVHQGARLRTIFLLVSPLEDAAGHLKLLQRLTALAPELPGGLARAGNPAQVIARLMRVEDTSTRPTFINLTQEQVAQELRTDLTLGLSPTEAQRRLGLHGPNLIRKRRRTPWYIRLVRNMFSFFALLLWAAALLCFVPGVDMPHLGTAILIVVLINGLFAFLQEQRSNKAVEALQGLLAHKCRVVRGGQSTEIQASSLVPGDLLILEQGQIVPADARLIEANEIEVDNSSLTGESTSSRRYKSDRPALLPGRFLWIELPNVVFAGSVLVRGAGRAVVFGTGMTSEVGKIAHLTQSITSELSPLQKQIQGTVYSIALLAGGLGLAFLLLGWLAASLNFVQAFIFFIGIFVANVPEGLLPTVTLSLSMGVSRMARRNAIVKNLASVETLGCTTVICSDKTGTLTQNQMTVSRFWVDGRAYEVGGLGYRPRGDFRLAGEKIEPEKLRADPAVGRLLECALLCNNTRLEPRGADWRVLGDPTEGALLVLAGKAGLATDHRRVHQNPFDSIRKRMSVVLEPRTGGSRTLYLKGAMPETLDLCDRILSGGQVRPLSGEERSRVMAAHDQMASQGLRILALAFRELDKGPDAPALQAETLERELIFIGFTAMSDPVRPGVTEAVQSCHEAGIRIIMITGDYPLTAASIGRQIGMTPAEPGRVEVYNGADLVDMDDRTLGRALRFGEPIFARVAPEQKLRIVSLLKDLGEVVAVTGDGVNDGPALRRADIGIAMGMRGTDVAKEAAHMVLRDDNFASIVAAIEEGRTIFENIKRFVAYILNSNPQELYPYIFWMLFPDTPLAMTVMGVLAVDVGTDLIPAMGLGVERPKRGFMTRPPRDKNERLLSLKFILRSYFVQGSILALACYSTYYFAGWYLGWWSPGESWAAMPPSPPGLDMRLASPEYLMSLTAYFFPTVSTQIANVLCKRSWEVSILSRDFLPPQHRQEILDQIRRFGLGSGPETAGVESREAGRGTPLRRGASWLGDFFEHHPIVLNFVSNPLIDLGIAFELMLCLLFFYTGLAGVYYFAPVPWPVYLFAFHGAVLLFAFEEIKKYYRRKGRELSFLG